MKVLIINDLYERGGAELMARLQKRILEDNGHNVILVTIDSNVVDHNSKEKGHYSIGKKYNVFESIIYRFIKDKRLYIKMKRIISDFKPDIIHLHNIYMSSKAVYMATDGYRCVQTIHDYSIVCTKSTSIYPNGKICCGFKFNSCLIKCFRGTITDRIIFLGRLLALNLNNKLKRKYVKLFISPSEYLKQSCNNNGFNTVTINNPSEFSEEDKKNIEFIFEKKLFLYFGAINKVKGVKELIKAFKVFSENKRDVSLLIAGPINPDFKHILHNLIDNCDNITYIGKIEHNKIVNLLRHIHTVVIPSLWIENYPGTLIEAVLCKCLVIASDRGGMPEMLGNNELLFDILDTDSIVSRLEHVYAMNEDTYKKITDRTYHRILKITNKNLYLEQLIKIYMNLPGS